MKNPRLVRAAVGISALVACASPANADMMLRLSDSITVWNGGIAWNNGNGWYGQGWDRFPGVNPPWNPIVEQPAPVVEQPAVVVNAAPLTRCRAEPPAPRNLTLGCNGEDIPVQIRW